MMKPLLNSSKNSPLFFRAECAQAPVCVDDVMFDVLPQYQAHTHAGRALFTLLSIPHTSDKT